MKEHDENEEVVKKIFAKLNKSIFLNPLNFDEVILKAVKSNSEVNQSTELE